MPRSSWVLVLAVVGLTLTGGAFAQQKDGNVGSNNKAGQTNAEPQNRPEPPGFSTIESLIDRIERAVDTQNHSPDAKQERERAIRDVNAQEAMAYWAKVMTWATWAGVGVGLGSFVLLWLTARYAKEAAAAAQRAANSAQESVVQAREATKLAEITADVSREALLSNDRAWIRIDAKLAAPLTFGLESITASALITVRNIGKSPATNVTILSYPLFTDIAAAGTRAQEDAKRSAIISPGLTNTGRVLFPGDDFTVDYKRTLAIEAFRNRIDEMNVSTLRPAILVGLCYLLPGDRRSRYTFIPFEIRTIVNESGFDGSPRVVQPKYLEIVQNIVSGQIS